MKTVGIIAEFNPFHNGHKHLVEQAKEKTGADCCVIIMSGDFVQRGAPAICNKYLRTEMALKGGADIVFELPTVYALGSAETFAEGAIRLLCSTGQVDYLCFGSECGDTEKLSKCASIIEEYTATDEFKDKLSMFIKSGTSYPSAFSSALSDSLGTLQPLLFAPNNLLGIEYLRALIRLKASNDFHLPTPIAIKRMGSNHFDSDLTEISSAGSIRDFIISINRGQNANPEKGMDNFEALSYSLPDHSYKLMTQAYNRLLPITEDDFGNMLYMRLNTMTDKELFSIPDVNPDLIHKLIDFRGKGIGVSDLIMGLKTKCFTYTAISRALFRMLLCPLYIDAVNFIKGTFAGANSPCIPSGDSPIKQNTNMAATGKPYLRLLGFNKNSSDFLRTLRYSEQIDIITKPADGPLSDPSYMLDVYASNLYEQVCSDKFKSDFTEELKAGPIMV